MSVEKKVLYLIYQPYKFIVVMPVLGLSTFICGTLTIILLNFFNSKTVGKICGVSWARINSYVTPMFLTIKGREHVDPDQSYVIVSNHQSHFDIFVLYGWLGIDFKWVMKEQLKKIPFLGPACVKLEHIFIDRSNHSAALASINRAKKNLVNGTSVLFFPEGTRSPDGQLLPFKKGAFRMAIDLNIPLLPISISGTKAILPRGTINLLPGKASMTFHPPISAGSYNIDNITELMDKVRSIIQSAV